MGDELKAHEASGFDRPVLRDQHHQCGFIHRLDAYYDLKLQLSTGRIRRDYLVLCHGFLSPDRHHIRARVTWKAGIGLHRYGLALPEAGTFAAPLPEAFAALLQELEGKLPSDAQVLKRHSTSRLIVRLIDSGDQYAVKPENLRTTQQEANELMGSELEDVSIYNPALQSEAAKLRESGKLDDLQNDPELKPVFEECTFRPRLQGPLKFEEQDGI
eukprot:s2099_g6.t1